MNPIQTNQITQELMREMEFDAACWIDLDSIAPVLNLAIKYGLVELPRATAPIRQDQIPSEMHAELGASVDLFAIPSILNVAAKHGLVSLPTKWIEITDDPATWPPTERLVIVRYEDGEESFGVRYVNHRDCADYKYFRDVCNVEWDREGKPLLYFDDYDAPCIYAVTHWRSIP